MIHTTSFFDLAPDALDEVDFDAELLNAVIDHWHSCLMTSDQRDAILRGLGVSLALARRLRLGFSDRTLGLRIPGRRWKAGLAMRTRLEQFGIFRESGHEAFRGCVVVPLISDGIVTSVYGQRLERGRGDVWTEGMSAAVFEVNTVIASPMSQALLTMSIVDALRVLGALETSGSTETYSVFAPGRAQGYNSKDLKNLAARHLDLVVLGRNADQLAEKLVRLGATVSSAGADSDLASTIPSASTPSRVLDALLAHATPHASEQEISAEEMPVPVLEPGLVMTPTPGRDEVFVSFSTRSWRIRGARARGNVEGDRLAVALSVSDTTSGRFHLDTLDLYVARQRATFLDVAASELTAIRDQLSVEMTEVLNSAERARDDVCDNVGRPSAAMTETDRAEALAWLEDPHLFDNLNHDLTHLGVVGEATNLLLCYLAVISRKGERPLGVLVQSSSAGGKSTLVEAICSLVPAEDLVSLSALTPQALYYLGGNGLRRKVLSVAEEHGSLRASYALKLLLSEGRLAIASTGKDRSSGRLRTSSYETTGPVALLMTTTATDIDPELESRLVVVGVNEDRAQTEAIIEAQRRGVSLAGLLARDERTALCRRHTNVQRLLEPLPVVIGAFETVFPAFSTRHRRDHAKLLSLIAAITLLHQYQRETKTAVIAGETLSYLEATSDDVERGVELAHRVLARGTEHLAPQARRLLAAVREYADLQSHGVERESRDIEVTRRELRELLGWSDTQVRSATERLVALEYLVVAGGGRGRCRTYRLVPDFAEIRATDARTSNASSSGEKGEFVEFVGFGDTNEHEREFAASYRKMEAGS